MTSDVSPRIAHVSWGRMEVAGVGDGKDFTLYPGRPGMGLVADWDPARPGDPSPPT